MILKGIRVELISQMVELLAHFIVITNHISIFIGICGKNDGLI